MDTAYTGTGGVPRFNYDRKLISDVNKVHVLYKPEQCNDKLWQILMSL